MMIDRIKKLIEEENLEDIEVKRILNMIERNEPVEAIYKQGQDSFGNWYKVECPACGEVMKFERHSQVVAPYSYCYHCGKKLRKKYEND